MDLWNSLNRLSDLCGYWDKRSYWLQKLILLSEKNQEWEDYVRNLTRSAWTLTMKYELPEAQKQLSLAYPRLKYIQNQAIIFQFYHCEFVLNIRKYDIESAENSLNKQAILFGDLKQQLDERLLLRYEIVHRQDSAKLDYIQGIIEIQKSSNFS